MTENLDLGRDADKVAPSNLAFDEALWRIQKCPAVRLRLGPAAGLIVGDGVKVELLAVCVAHNESDGTMIFGDREPLGSQSILDCGEVIQRHHEIEVIVRSCLFSEERVHTPPTIDSAVNARITKCGEQLQYAIRSQR